MFDANRREEIKEGLVASTWKSYLAYGLRSVIWFPVHQGPLYKSL